MIKKISYSLSAKVNCHVCDVLKKVNINNMKIFSIHESLLENVIKILLTIYQIKTKVLGKNSQFWV